MNGEGKKSIGRTLSEALDHLVTIDALTPQLANKILLNFDVAIMDALAERKTEARLTFKVRLLPCLTSPCLTPPSPRSEGGVSKKI